MANGSVVIAEYQHDVTGDGKRETITLHGVPYSSDTTFLRKYGQ
ncbi:hypothetical protein ACI2OX_05210 [Bacillus sp. N9]